MSWYLANENKIIDQFASGRGLGDLRKASARYPALRAFFEKGVTTKIQLCIGELDQLAYKTHDDDVKVTAQGLAKLMGGQTLVLITQGLEYEGEAGESRKRTAPAKPVKATTRDRKRKIASGKKPPVTKAKKKSLPKKDRAWFARKVAELKTELEKLPADRQGQLKRELEDEAGQRQ